MKFSHQTVLLGFMALIATTLHAQTLRDPTQPPAVPGAGIEGSTVTGEPLSDGGMAVVVRDGKPYLVSGTRLYGVGQKLGQFRIERISETEVWLRNGADLRKLPRFAGVRRVESKPAAPCGVPPVKPVKSSKSSSSSSPKVAPCAGAQP
jgi:hypothetical protein